MNSAAHTPVILIKVKHPLCFVISYPCSTCYTAVWVKNCLKSTSVIKVATMKITGSAAHPSILTIIFYKWSIFYVVRIKTYHLCNQGSCYEKWEWFPLHKGNHRVQPPYWHSGTLRTLASPWRMHCMYYGMPQAEATSNNVNQAHSFSH